MKFLQRFTYITFIFAAMIASASAADEATALAVLSSDAGIEEKANACNDLARVGTAKAVPALAKLLPDEKLHDYARNALAIIKDPAAGKALLSEMKKTRGDLKFGIILSLGDRREKAAVPALSKMALSGFRRLVDVSHQDRQQAQ